MPEIETDAVVLRRVDYGEADWILTLLTRDAGKLSALARAARKSRRRFGGALLSFTVSTAQLHRRPKSELWTLAAATPRLSFPAIAEDVASLAHASYATELCRELVAQEVVEASVFDLLVELYHCVAERGPVPSVLRGFELALLREVGLEPRWLACGVCGADDAGDLDRGAIFDPSLGGIVCARCSPSSRGLGVRPVAADVRKYLCACADASSLAHCAELAPEPSTARAARELMLDIVQSHVGAPLKSLEFVAKLSSAPG